MIKNVNLLLSFLLSPVFLDNYAYKIVNKEMTDYLDEYLFEDWILLILHYDRIDISEGIDFAKSTNSKARMICH